MKDVLAHDVTEVFRWVVVVDDGGGVDGVGRDCGPSPWLLPSGEGGALTSWFSSGGPFRFVETRGKASSSLSFLRNVSTRISMVLRWKLPISTPRRIGPVQPEASRSLYISNRWMSC